MYATLQVLNIINFAESALFADNPAMADAQVMVHLASHVQVRLLQVGVPTTNNQDMLSADANFSDVCPPALSLSVCIWFCAGLPGHSVVGQPFGLQQLATATTLGQGKNSHIRWFGSYAKPCYHLEC